MTVFDLLKTGGATIVVLILCSIISWAVTLERFIYFRKRSGTKRADFMMRIRGELQKGDVQRAIQVSDMTTAPYARVVHEGLRHFGQDTHIVANAMERQTSIEINELQKWSAINGTIGSVAVYIGLFGTVLGIISAFHDIARSGSGGLNVAIKGISEALVCTAAGLIVAVPAVVVYNFFMKKVDQFTLDMELAASELLDFVKPGKK